MILTILYYTVLAEEEVFYGLEQRFGMGTILFYRCLCRASYIWNVRTLPMGSGSNCNIFSMVQLPTLSSKVMHV